MNRATRGPWRHTIGRTPLKFASQKNLGIPEVDGLAFCGRKIEAIEKLHHVALPYLAADLAERKGTKRDGCFSSF